MFGGGGGMDPRKMKQMMEQMGVDMDELDAEEVVITTDDEEYVFDDAEVMKIDARGQETYQIVGSPEIRERSGEGGAAIESGADEDETGDDGGEIPDSDVQIVAQRTGASESEAREALRETDGDLAAAVDRLE